MVQVEVEVGNRKNSYESRGSKFPGELSDFCSPRRGSKDPKDGGYYWSKHKSVRHFEDLVTFVNQGLAGRLQHGHVAASSTSRALAELSTFEEGAVLNLPELLQATADQVLSKEPISLWNAEHVLATYKYLLSHNSQGITQEQYQSFADVIVKECQNRAQELENNIIPGAEYNFKIEDFYRQFNYIQALVGKIETTNGEDLEILISRLSAQNDLNLIENKKAEYEDSPTSQNARACYYDVVHAFNESSGSYVMDKSYMDGKIDFFLYSSPLLPAEQEVVQNAFSKFSQEMWRAAHPIRANISDVFNMYRGDWVETKQILGNVGRKLGLLPSPEAK